MKNFTYYSPTKIHFGKDQIHNLMNELKPYSNKTILLVYGFQSIKNNGIYQKIQEIANLLNITVVEESNVHPNPDISSVISGRDKCRENDVSFILAAGGGSVVDCAKAIAFSVFEEGDLWDIFLRKNDATKALPIGVIITLAATGSETNGNTVISNRITNEKRSVAYGFIVPQFAIIDPSYTLTVNKHHTIAGAVDIILHILEQYFSNTTRTETSDYMSIGVIRSVIENIERILDGSDDYETRANLSWASTIGLNWILGVDKVGDWATHRLSYVLTRNYNITHGYALVLLYISWLKVSLKYNENTMQQKLTLLGRELFEETDPINVINKLELWFNKIGAKTKFKDIDLHINKSDIDEMVDTALALGPVGTVVKIDKEKATEIFVLSNGGFYE